MVNHSGHESSMSVMPSVEKALAEDIGWSWPGAAIRHSGPFDEGHIFWIRAYGKDYRLLLNHRARWHAEMRDDAVVVVEALRAQRWIEFLLEHGCGHVTLVEDDYVLKPCP